VRAVAFEVWLAVAYAGFLLLAAFLLDRLARRAASRSARWRTGSFTYHPDHDAWLCPEDQWLWPQSFDPDNRVMRYRASPTVCNACPVKDSCTSGDHGREVTRNVDPWPSSEAERFHRGVACTIVVLAAAWPLLTMLGDRTATELLLLGLTVVVVALGSLPLWSHLRRSPAGFPEQVPVESLDDTVMRVRKQTGASRRTSYASDRRRDNSSDGPAADGRPAGWSRLGRS
jgi:hypothetical protein